jgi:hypothetical protein
MTEVLVKFGYVVSHEEDLVDGNLESCLFNSFLQRLFYFS